MSKLIKLSIEVRKKQVFNYIKHSICTRGYSPSLSEIGKKFRISKTGAEYIIKKLVKDGKIIKTAEKIRNIKLNSQS